jgi:hypothetical protein
MKKRVRIYGAGGSNPFSMKTAAPWRAQEGGTQQQPQYSDEQLISSVMTIIGEQGGTPEDALNQLVSAGVDQAKASQLVESAVNYINSQAEERNAEMSGQDYEANKLAEEDAALTAQAEADQEYEARKQRYQQMMTDNEDTTDYGDDTDVASNIIAKFGGALPNKRTFVKNVMNLTKKQMGGDGTSNKADDTDTGVRKNGLSDFITGLQGHANQALMKQDAEAMYDMYSQDMTNNLDYGYDTDQDYMQLGGMRPGQMRRMNRRANRMMGQMPAGMFNNRSQMFPTQMNIMGMGMPMTGLQQFIMPDQGSYAGGPQLANIDVRRTGLFGRPKEYSITFAQEAYNNPKLREDVVKQEANNQQEKAKEIWTEVEVDAKNTATEKNAEVKTEAEKTKVTTAEDTKAIQDQGSSTTNNGATEANTEITKAEEKPKVEVAPKAKPITESSNNAINYTTKDVVFNPGNPKAGYVKVNDKWYVNSNYETDTAIKDETWTEVTDPTRIKNIEKFKPNQFFSTAGQYQYLDNTPYLYSVDERGSWSYTVPNDDGTLREGAKSFPVKDKKTLAKLNTSAVSGKGTKGAILGTLKKKPGYYYRQLNDGSYAKFKGDTAQHYINKEPVALIKKDKSNAQWKYLDDNFQSSGRYVTGEMKQFGGMTMEDSGLYKFVYGGDDAVPTPFEENTADPYFQTGGSKQAEYKDWLDRMYGDDVTEGYSRQNPVSYDQWMADYYPDETTVDETTVDKNKEVYDKAKAAGVNVGEYREGIDYSKVIPSSKSNTTYNPQTGAMYPPVFGGRRQFGPAGRTIEYAGSWAQQQGMTYDPRTGKPVNAAMMGNQPLSKIDVTKTSLFGKRPKEYTMYFGNYGQFDTKDGKTADSNVDNEDQMAQGSRRQKLADLLLRTPGLRQVGARMYPSSNFAPTEKTTINNNSTAADQRANDVPTKGIRAFVNDQLNLNLNREPRVAPKSEFGEYAPYNPDMIDMQKRNSFPDYYEFGEGKPNTTMAYGGYLPQAQSGMIGVSDIEPMAELKPKSSKDVWESVEPEIRESWGLEDKEPEIERQGYAAKFKNKNMYNVDFERGVNQFNTLANFGIQKLGERGDKGIQQNFYDNLTGDNLYGSTNLQDRGTYDTNSGLFRPDQMGFKGIIRNGGFLQEGGYTMPEYDQDEEAYMTQDEIDQFLADGGELEYL